MRITISSQIEVFIVPFQTTSGLLKKYELSSGYRHVLLHRNAQNILSITQDKIFNFQAQQNRLHGCYHVERYDMDDRANKSQYVRA